MIAIPRPVPTLVDGGWATFVGTEDGRGLLRGQLVRALVARASGTLWSGKPWPDGDRFLFHAAELCPMVRG